ncbi:hypothetical protein [Corynebacterium capitovis]|nr:hypothetical protein [Corynebacterium capitovis]
MGLYDADSWPAFAESPNGCSLTLFRFNSLEDELFLFWQYDIFYAFA